MKRTKANTIYGQFYEKYGRACKFLINLYDCTDDYPIELLVRDFHVNWHRFKRLAKHVNDILEGKIPLQIKHCMRMELRAYIDQTAETDSQPVEDPNITNT